MIMNNISVCIEVEGIGVEARNSLGLFLYLSSTASTRLDVWAPPVLDLRPSFYLRHYFVRNTETRTFTFTLYSLLSAKAKTPYVCKWAERGYGYRSTGHLINGPNINELQINCSIGQQNPVDV
jgi:hypothetical protein